MPMMEGIHPDLHLSISPSLMFWKTYAALWDWHKRTLFKAVSPYCNPLLPLSPSSVFDSPVVSSTTIAVRMMLKLFAWTFATIHVIRVPVFAQMLLNNHPSIKGDLVSGSLTPGDVTQATIAGINPQAPGPPPINLVFSVLNNSTMVTTIPITSYSSITGESMHAGIILTVPTVGAVSETVVIFLETPGPTGQPIQTVQTVQTVTLGGVMTTTGSATQATSGTNMYSSTLNS
ncbi:hypothetical protein F5880DRAFT_111131 [Lentinula raphanica]|nr:hypothetical protein F5880DRAFT_111131 [Lentinula raphanica]